MKALVLGGERLYERPMALNVACPSAWRPQNVQAVGSHEAPGQHAR
jgi:hypothetical protein